MSHSFWRNIMRRSYLLNLLAILVVLLFTAIAASAQTGQLRGSVKIMAADGTSAPATNAVVDVYRTDMAGDYHTKSDKKGEWVFAGLPYVGTYVVSISAPGASPLAKAGVKAGRDVPVDMVLPSGDGKKLSREEAVAAGNTGAATAANGSDS